MRNIYKGSVKINNVDYPFVFSDFLLAISTGSIHDVRWEDIHALSIDGIIELFDYQENKLILYVERYDYLHFGEYGIYASGYILRPVYYGVEDCHNVKITSLLFKHSIINYFFKFEKSTLENYIDLLNEHKEKNNINNTITLCEYPLIVKCSNYNLDFGIMSEIDSFSPSPLSINNYIIVKNENGIEIGDIKKVVLIIKSFLQFISQSNAINIPYIPLNLHISQHNNSFVNDAELYLKPEVENYISDSRVFKYDNIKTGLSNVLKLIVENQICFRSLYNASESTIYHYDIMNICAAFEAQFSLQYKNYQFKEQKKVKRKMIKALEISRKDYPSNELEHFDCILQGFKNVNETLKNRLEIALDEFVKIYGEEDTKFEFKEDYQLFPERIKKSRDAFAHGNLKQPINISVFTDIQLLRAITYMLILKEAGIEDKDIKVCLRKMSKFPL